MIKVGTPNHQKSQMVIMVQAQSSQTALLSLSKAVIVL